MRRRRDGHDTIAQKCNGSDHVGVLRCTKRFTPAPMLKNGHAAYYLCSFQIWRRQFSELFSLGSQRRFVGIERELDVDVWQTSVPSGRCLPLDFGMYTRRTGFAFQGWKVAKSSTSRPRAWGVFTTSLSTPGVFLPALTCVTLLTLTRMFE